MVLKTADQDLRWIQYMIMDKSNPPADREVTSNLITNRNQESPDSDALFEVIFDRMIGGRIFVRMQGSQDQADRFLQDTKLAQ
jgi:hypothetical protein